MGKVCGEQGEKYGWWYSREQGRAQNVVSEIVYVIDNEHYRLFQYFSRPSGKHTRVFYPNPAQREQSESHGRYLIYVDSTLLAPGS
jgi:hypothetical protein